MRIVKVALFVACLVPAGDLLWRALFGGRLALTANPIQFVTHRTGDWALRLLLVTLAITPARRLTGWHSLIRLRRPLGLFAFFYATLHLLTYVVLDYFFAWNLMIENVWNARYITAGLLAYALMVPLALTSTTGWIVRLGGARWQAVHRLVYVSTLAGVVHYAWMGKVNPRVPLTYGLVLVVLLALRQLRRPPRVRAVATPVAPPVTD